MRIIYLLIVCLGLATAKYLPNESVSLTQLRRHLRSIEDDSAVINDKSDDDSDEDTSDERTIEEQLQQIEEERQELLQKQEEEQLKQQEKIEKEERKRQEKIEKEERKRQEKQEKEERKRQEKIEKANRKQEEADRKNKEKIEKEERKHLEKLQKQLEKDSLKNNKIPSDSSESLETDESKESLDLEDIWKNHIYLKYGLSINSTDLERKAVLNKYLEEELGLNVNSTKSERRLAVIELIQNNLNNDSASQDVLRNYILKTINVVAIQQLQDKLEFKIAKLNNESLLLENGSVPWVPEEKQTIDEKRTLIQSVLQFLSHLLPNWATSGQTPSNINSNTTSISQGASGSSVSIDTTASNVNVVSPNISEAASSGTPELTQGSASGSVGVNNGSNTVVASSTDASQTSGALSGAEGSATLVDVSSTSIATGGNVATSSVDIINSSGTNGSGASVSTASNIDSTIIGVSSPSEISGSSADQQDTDPMNGSTAGFSPSSDNSEITSPASSINVQESVSSGNSTTVSNVSPETVDNSVVTSVQDSVPANSSPQESSGPLGETVLTTGSVNVSTNDMEAPATSSIDGSSNAVLTSGDSAVVTGSNNSSQSSDPPGEAVPTTGSVNVPTTDIEAQATSSIDGSVNAVSTPGDSAAVTGSNSSTQESSVPSGEDVPITGSVNISTSDFEVPVISSINSSSNTVSTSSDSAAVTGPTSSTQESSVPSVDPVPTIDSVNLAGFDEAPASSYIGGSLSGISTSGDSTAVIRPIETELPSAQESQQTTGVNDLTLAGAKPSVPVDVSSTGTIAPENYTIDTSSNLPTGTTNNSDASISTATIDIAVADIEQATIGSIDATQINSETNSNVVPAAEPIDIAATAEVPAEDVSNVVTVHSSADVLPSINSPNIEVATGSGVLTESSTNVNATEAASVSMNVSNSPDAIIVPSDIPTYSNIAASSISGVSESTKVDIAPTTSPDVIATDATVIGEIVTDKNVALTEVASAPEVNKIPEGHSSIISLPNEPGASVIEITPQ